MIFRTEQGADTTSLVEVNIAITCLHDEISLSKRPPSRLRGNVVVSTRL